MKKNINFFCFFSLGIVLGVILIIVSEFFKFSHLNLVPFGGRSWALWVFPFSIFLGLFISSFLFKIKNKLKILSLLTIFITVVFFFLANGGLFANPVPFSH